jgi:hypothetical protein
MNRQEHIEWAKTRALQELEADPHGRGPLNAISSITSDLREHPDTADHSGIILTTMLAMNGHLGTAAQVRDHINGIQ